MTDDDLNDIFKEKPVIDTKRLTLVPPSKKYVTDMFEYCKLEEVAKYLTWNNHSDVSVTKRYVSDLCRKSKRGLCREWFMIEKKT